MSPQSEGLLCLWVSTLSQVLEASCFVPRDAQVLCQPARDRGLCRGPARSAGEPGWDPRFVCFRNAQTSLLRPELAFLHALGEEDCVVQCFSFLF